MSVPNQHHRLRSIVAPRGVAFGGVLTCECGWFKRYTLLAAALRAHERHQVFAFLFLRATAVMP